MDEQTQMQMQDQQQEIAELKARLKKVEAMLDNTWYMAFGALLLTLIFRYGFKGLVGTVLMIVFYFWFKRKG
jgi:hypothetical protein